MPAGDSASEPTSHKPRILSLDDGLLIPESDFPVGGKFRLSPIRGDGTPTSGDDKCDPNSWLASGFQETAANVTVGTDSALRFGVELFTLHTDPDLTTWRTTCLPRTDDHATMSVTELPGVPSWAVAVEVSASGADTAGYTILSSYRGILVSVSVSGPRDKVTTNSRSEMVRMFTAQITRLEAR
ncbi:hypothetical protein ACWEKT_38200 [Nocardia takedensis]|uniref:hypothetical protein n=1 Tax=Nocardia takedensis TaxID=259390 RepID=UPI000592A585|nr:hypothetical protein [Nocardia takedensis]